jgi:FMN phosphatase YigB (HAD superfamily)
MAPSEILFFDDNFANVNAAAACGWNTVLIDPAGNVEAQIREALGPLE